MTKYTPRGKYLPLPLSRGILPTMGKFYPRGQMRLHDEFTLGVNLPQGQTYAYKRGITSFVFRPIAL